MQWVSIGSIIVILLGTQNFATAQEQVRAIPESYVGTTFRGLALGQTPEEVEKVLAGHGLRCLRNEELPTEHLPLPNPWLEPACRLGWQTLHRGWESLPSYELQIFEMYYGVPFYGILFVEGRAAALSLDAEYFNATDMPVAEFASRIFQNYPVVEGYARPHNVWEGFSEKGEKIVVRAHRSNPVVVITLNPGIEPPSFN